MTLGCGARLSHSQQVSVHENYEIGPSRPHCQQEIKGKRTTPSRRPPLRYFMTELIVNCEWQR